jgi:hypothetical protein
MGGPRSAIRLSRAYWLTLALFLALQIADIRHDQPRADDPGDLGGQPADGLVPGQARRRLVAAEAGRRRLSSMRRRLLHPPALAGNLRGLGLRPRRAREYQSFLTAAPAHRSPVAVFTARRGSTNLPLRPQGEDPSLRRRGG